MSPRWVAFCLLPTPQAFKFGEGEKLYKEVWIVPLIPKGTCFFVEKDSLKNQSNKLTCISTPDCHREFTWKFGWISIHQYVKCIYFFLGVGRGGIVVYIIKYLALYCLSKCEHLSNSCTTLISSSKSGSNTCPPDTKYLYHSWQYHPLLSGQFPWDLPHLGAPPSRTICLKSYIFCSLPHVWFYCLADILFWWRSKL